MNFLPARPQPVDADRGRGSDATPVRLPPRAQAMQQTALKVQHSIRQKYGWQQHPEEPQGERLGSGSSRPTAQGQPQSLKRALGLPEASPAGGRFGMIPKPPSTASLQPLAQIQQARQIPHSPRLLNKGLNGMAVSPFNQNQSNGFRHVRIASDEFNIHDPRHTGMASSASPGHNRAIQMFNQKIAMANGAHSGGPKPRDGADRVPELANPPSQVEQPASNMRQQTSSSDDEDDLMMDMNEHNDPRQRLVNTVQGPTILHSQGGWTAAHAIPSSLPQQRPFNYHKHLADAKEDLKERFKANILPMSRQDPDSEVSASEWVDSSAMEYWNRPPAEQEDQMALIFRPQMAANDAGDLRKRGETESVMQEETTVLLNLTENRTQDKRSSRRSENKDSLPPYGPGRRTLEGSQRSQKLHTTSVKREEGDVLILKRNNQASKNAPTLNSDEVLDGPVYEFKDEMTVLEMQEAEDADPDRGSSSNGEGQAEINGHAAEAGANSSNEFDALQHLEKSKTSKIKSFNSPDGNAQEQAPKDDENDDEILNYSKMSQSKASHKRNGQTADTREAQKEEKDPQRAPPQEVANSSQLESDPYGLNEKGDSSLLGSKLELHDQEPTESAEGKNDLKQGANSENNLPKNSSSSLVGNQLQQEVDQRLYTAKTNKSNVEMPLSGKDMAKSGVALSSPFVLSQDLASDVQVAEGAGAVDSEARQEAGDHAQINEDQEPHSEHRAEGDQGSEVEVDRNPASKKSSRQDLSDLSVIASQRSQLQPFGPARVNTEPDIKRKCSKIRQRLEEQRWSMMERRRSSNVSDDASRTITAPKVQGHCKVTDPSRNSQLRRDMAPAEVLLGRVLLTGEVSMVSNNDNVKSTEWNNLRDLNDNLESSNTQRDSKRKTSPQAPFRQQQEANQIIEENKEEDPANIEERLEQQNASQRNCQLTQSTREHSKNQNLNIDYLPSERCQVIQADYKKFVYSPREQFSLRAGEANLMERRTIQERPAPGRPANSSSQSSLHPIAMPTRAVDQPRNQQNGTKKELNIVLLGDEGTGKTSIIKYLRERRPSQGARDGLTVEVNGAPFSIQLHEWRTPDPQSAEQMADVDGFFVLFDVSDKNTLEGAKKTIATLREQVNVPLVCLAHKIDAIIQMSDTQLAEKGISEAELASFSSAHSVKVAKTSTKLPKLLDESFQLMLSQVAATKSANAGNHPASSLKDVKALPGQPRAPGIQQAFVNAEPNNRASIAQQNELELAAQNIANIQINTQARQSDEDQELYAYLNSTRVPGGGDAAMILREQKQEAAAYELALEEGVEQERNAHDNAAREQRDSQTKLGPQQSTDEITIKAVVNVAATARSAQRSQKDHSLRRHSIYEQLLSQQVLKQKPIKNKLKSKRGSVASVSLLVNNSEIQKAGEAAEARSPGPTKILGDISLENKVKDEPKALRARKKSSNKVASRKYSTSRGQDGKDEQEQRMNSNPQKGDPQAKTVKKKTKRKTYRGIFETAQRASKKRNSTQTTTNKQGESRGKEKPRDDSSHSDVTKFNLQKFNQLICEDIARTRERLDSREGRTSGPKSEQNTPAKNHSRLTQLHAARQGDLLRGDLANDGSQNKDEIRPDRQYYQRTALPKSHTEDKKNTRNLKENAREEEDECSPLLEGTRKAAEVQEAQSARTKTRYLDDAKAYVNIIEGLKQTIADGGTHTHNANNPTTTSNHQDTRNNGASDELGRPSGNGKDTFKYFIQAEQAAVDNHEFESLIDRPKSSKPLSRGSKSNNMLKAGPNGGMFNDNVLSKFGDQSSISRDDQASTNIVVADSSVHRTKQSSPKRIKASKMAPSSAHASYEASATAKLKQKWKTRTSKKARNKLGDKSSDKHDSPNRTQHSLMSDQKLRSKFQDLLNMRQGKTKSNMNQTNNMSNSASSRSLLVPQADQGKARILAKSSSKRSLPGTMMIGDRKFVTKYRDPSLPIPLSSRSGDQEPRIQAIPIPAQQSARDEEAMQAQQRRYLQERQHRQNKIKERIKNIDKLQSPDFDVTLPASRTDDKPHSLEPGLKREKKNFRDMFTKVKVFEFQSSLAQQQRLASPRTNNNNQTADGSHCPFFNTQSESTPVSVAEPAPTGRRTEAARLTAGGGPSPTSNNPFASSQVSEQIQDRYLTTTANHAEAGPSNFDGANQADHQEQEPQPKVHVSLLGGRKRRA